MIATKVAIGYLIPCPLGALTSFSLVTPQPLLWDALNLIFSQRPKSNTYLIPTFSPNSKESIDIGSTKQEDW